MVPAGLRPAGGFKNLLPLKGKRLTTFCASLTLLQNVFAVHREAAIYNPRDVRPVKLLNPLNPLNPLHLTSATSLGAGCAQNPRRLMGLRGFPYFVQSWL